MPINFDSPNLTPQQVLNSIDDGSLKDSLHTGKIGWSQVLYVASGADGNTVRGKRFHSFKASETENAKEAVINWVKGLGLLQEDTALLVGNLQKATQLKGQDLEYAARYAREFNCQTPVRESDRTVTNMQLKPDNDTQVDLTNRFKSVEKKLIEKEEKKSYRRSRSGRQRSFLTWRVNPRRMG